MIKKTRLISFLCVLFASLFLCGFTQKEKTHTEYTYSELFGTEEALDRYEAQKMTKQKLSHTYDLLDGDSRVDWKRLYSIVTKNNKQYLKEHKNHVYKKLRNKELKTICQIIAQGTNEYLQKCPDIDKDELSCLLGYLKVFKRPSLNNAGVTDDRCLYITPETMNILAANARKNQNAYEQTILHETMHLIQLPCVDVKDRNTGEYSGISYKWDDLEVNPLDFNWLYEGSAELCAANMTGYEPLVYTAMIGYIDSLNLVSIFKDDINIHYTEELSLYRDLDLLFDQFDCKTRDDKVELVNMMMSINIIQTEPNDFTDKYENIYKCELDKEEYAKVKCTIKAQVMDTLTKYFYRNLTSALESKNVSLEDIFYVIRIFESDICSHIQLQNENYDAYNKNFVEMYVDKQNKFFNWLSEGNKYTKQEIISAFDKYEYEPLETDAQNLKWMGIEKKEYIENFAKEKEYWGEASIYRYNELSKAD